ncbi:radical SAM protein, partial [bacterium]|nr:radical SAM protein [bacterium]
RLCFDPVLRVDRWQSMYAACVDQTFSSIPADKLKDISVGVFRMNADYLSRITKQRTNSDILYYPFKKSNGTVSYSSKEREEMAQFMLGILEKYNSKEKIFV